VEDLWRAVPPVTDTRPSPALAQCRNGRNLLDTTSGRIAGEETGQVPAAAALDSQLAALQGERVESVPLGFEDVVAARGEPSTVEEHWFRVPQRREFLLGCLTVR